jgi:hypothetical protein
MNSMTRKPGERAILPPPRDTITRTDDNSEKEVQRLAAIVQENRAALERGWQELDRLTHELASLDASKRSDLSPNSAPSEGGPATYREAA